MGPLLTANCRGICLHIRIITIVVFVTIMAGLVSSHETRYWDRVLVASGSSLLILSAIILHEMIRTMLVRAAGAETLSLEFNLVGACPHLLEKSNRPRTEVLSGSLALATIALMATTVFCLKEIPSPDSRLHSILTISSLAVGGIAVSQTLPVLPMDGGRLVRGFLWHLSDDPLKGSRGTAVYGHVVAVGMIGSGIYLLVQPGSWPYWGLGLVVAGLQFVATSASSVRDTFCQLRANSTELENLNFPWSGRVSESASLAEAVDRLIAERNGPPLLVTDHQNKVVGMLSQQNLKRTRRADWLQRTAGSVMTPISQLTTFSTRETVLDVYLSVVRDPKRYVVLEDTRGTIRLVDRRTMVNQLYASLAAEREI